MNNHFELTFDPKVDLRLERVIAVPAHLVWKAWTTPELLEQWFTPRPWRTTDVVFEGWPGGKFATTMRGPDGESFIGVSCILAIKENENLVWSSAIGPEFRPWPASKWATEVDFPFTAFISMRPEGAGTHYSVILRHADEQLRDKHDLMGFEGGWGSALDQLVELMQSEMN